MRALILGAGGQLGLELAEAVPVGWELRTLSRAMLDITDEAAVHRALREAGPDVVFNAAAYTAVDRAEAEPAAANAVNALGAGNVAAAARALGARLLHVSTDFVFDGEASRPYAPGAHANPLGVYGRTKLAGEVAVAERGDAGALIVRTAWVYSRHGANFVKTMLRLMATRDSVGVVDDQVGTPTWAGGLARALWAAAARPDVAGVLHWTDAGVASWYDFAVAIRDEAAAAGRLTSTPDVRPIRTEDYPTPARRPAYSVLDKTSTWAALGVTPVHWRSALRQMLLTLDDA